MKQHMSRNDLQRRLDRKWSFRYTAKVLETVFKPDGTDRDRHIDALIRELTRRGRVTPCLKKALTYFEGVDKRKREQV